MSLKGRMFLGRGRDDNTPVYVPQETAFRGAHKDRYQGSANAGDMPRQKQ